MVKESIHIKSFGPINDIRIEDIKPLTVLIGESAGGKSTVMKVLVLFRWLFKRHNLSEYLRHRKEQGYSLPTSLEKDVFPNTGLHPFVKSDSEVTYIVSYETGGGNISSCKFHWRAKQGLTVEGEISPSDLMYLKLSFIPETRGFIPSALNKTQLPRGADFGFFFHEVFNEFGESNEFVKRLELPYLNVDYRVEKSGIVPEHRITGRASKYDIEIKHSSSGIQNLIPLLSIVEMYALHFDPKSAVKKQLPRNISEFETETNILAHRIDLHIEEPELGLFPDAQCDLMNVLVRQCFIKNKNHLSVIMATHSPYILNHLNLLIRAHDKNNTKLTAGAKLNYDEVAAYHVEAGGIEDLKRIVGQSLIDTNVLSDTMDDIYNHYEALSE